MGFLVRRASSQPAIPLALLICIVIAGVALLGLLGLLAFYCLPRRSRDGQSRFREMYPRSSAPRSRQLHPPPPQSSPSPPLPPPPPPSRMYPRIDREAPSVPFPNFPSSSFSSKPDLTAHPPPNTATLQNHTFSSSTSPLAKILQQTDPADVLAYAQQESVLTTDTQKQRELAEPRELVNPKFAPGRSAREWLEFSSTTSDDNNTFGAGIDHAMSHHPTRNLRYPGAAMISEDGAEEEDDDDDDDSSLTDEDEDEDGEGDGDEGEDEGQGSRTLQSASHEEEDHHSSPHHHRHNPAAAPNLQSLPPLSPKKTKTRPNPPQSSKFSHQSALPQRLNLQKKKFGMV